VTAGTLHHRYKERMHAVVVSQFWMKGRSQQVPLPNHDDPTVVTLANGSQDLNGRAHSLYPGGPNEYGPEWLAAKFGNVEVSFERGDLSPKGVASDGDVDATDGLLVGAAVQHLVGQHDHAGARSVDRKPTNDHITQRLQQIVALGEHVHRRRLATRNDEPIEPA
jgi:hypothetical protein